MKWRTSWGPKSIGGMLVTLATVATALGAEAAETITVTDSDPSYSTPGYTYKVIDINVTDSSIFKVDAISSIGTVGNVGIVDFIIFKAGVTIPSTAGYFAHASHPDAVGSFYDGSPQSEASGPTPLNAGPSGPLSNGAYQLIIAPFDSGGTLGDHTVTFVLEGVSFSTSDTTTPTVELTSNANDLQSGPFSVTATFSEDVTGFVEGDVSVSNGTVSNFQSTSGSVYTFDVTPTVDGPVTVDIAADVAENAATNGNDAATQLSVTTDSTGPILTGPSGGAGAATSTISVDENQTAVTQITASETIANWSLTGPDAGALSIDETGTITFDSAPDYENPTDLGDTAGNNTYVVTVSAEDEAGNESTKVLAVMVSPVYFPGQELPEGLDADRDGTPDSFESATADRDGDGIPDAQDYDPQGYFYCLADGRLLPGGRVSVTGPGNIDLVKDGVATAEYQWFVDAPGTYQMSIDVSGMEFQSIAVASSGLLDLSTLTENPTVIGSLENASTGYLGDFNGTPYDNETATAYFTQFLVAEGDPNVFGNNIPFENCEVNEVAITAVENGREPNGDDVQNGSFEISIQRTATVDTVISYNVEGTATNGEDYETLSGVVIIPAGELSATVSVVPIDDDLDEGAETVTLTLQEVEGDSATVLNGAPTATISIAEDLVDEIREPLSRILQADFEETITKQSRQFSALAAGATRRLHAGDPDVNRCGSSNGFDITGSAEATLDGFDASGEFGDDYFDCATNERVLSWGEFSISDSEDFGVQGMLSFRLAREKQDEDRIFGRFLGGYLSRTGVEASDASGRISGIGVNGGIYGAQAMNDGLFVDYYGAAAIGDHSYDLSFANQIDATGSYAYLSAFAGAAISGEQEVNEDFKLRPRVGIDVAYPVASDASVTARQLAVTDTGTIELDPVSALNIYAEAAMIFGKIEEEPSAQTFSSQLEITPRVYCDTVQSNGGSVCGYGGDLVWKALDQQNDIDWSFALGLEQSEQTTRADVSIEIRKEILGGNGFISTGLQADQNGRPSVSQGLEIRW